MPDPLIITAVETLRCGAGFRDFCFVKISTTGFMPAPESGGGGGAAVRGGAVPIVVEASAPGLPAATFSIPTSLDAEADGVLATADRYGGAPVLGFD